jgi:tetratricopeptide (TPR) repeat protein
VPSTPEASRFYYRGLEQLRTFDLLGSKDSFTRAIGLDPNFSLAHTYLAEAWEGLGYDEKARQESKTAFDLSSHLGREDRTVIEARFRAISGDWDAAVNLYRSLYTLYPENPEYAYRTTDAQVRGGKPDEALKTIAELRKQPESVTMDARLDLKEAEAEESLSDFAKEKAAASRAADDARGKGYRLLEAEALWRACAAMASLGEAQGARTACQASIALAQPVGDLLLVARGFTILGRIAEAQGDPAQGLQQHRHALEFARKIGSRRDIAGALTNIANAMASQGDLAGAQNSYQEALAVARDINDRNQIVTLLNNMATVSQTLGEYPAALRLYRQSLDEARAVLDKDSMARAQNNIGALYAMQGNFAPALQNVQQAVQEASETGHKNDQAQFLYALGEIKLLQGDLGAAESNFQAGLKLANQMGDKGIIALGQMSMADLKLQSGAMAEVEPLARPAADEFHTEGMNNEESAARNLLAAALIALARPDDAAKELDLIRGLSPQDPVVKLAVAITAARLQTAKTSGGSAKKTFEELTAQGKKLGLPEVQFEARLAQGEAALLRGNRQDGLAVLSTLEKDADRKGFRQFGTRARALAKQTPISKAS